MFFYYRKGFFLQIDILSQLYLGCDSASDERGVKSTLEITQENISGRNCKNSHENAYFCISRTYLLALHYPTKVKLVNFNQDYKKRIVNFI